MVYDLKGNQYIVRKSFKMDKVTVAWVVYWLSNL